MKDFKQPALLAKQLVLLMRASRLASLEMDFSFIHWVWSAAGQAPLHHSIRSQNLTSKVRSIYVNSVIVVSRNLDRIYEGAKDITFHSFSEVNIVKFLRKEHFLYSVFKRVILNLILYPALVLRNLCSVHVRTLCLLHRFMPTLCDTWLSWSIPYLDKLVSSSKWTYLSSEAKVSVSWALLII